MNTVLEISAWSAFQAFFMAELAKMAFFISLVIIIMMIATLWIAFTHYKGIYNKRKQLAAKQKAKA